MFSPSSRDKRRCRMRRMRAFDKKERFCIVLKKWRRQEKRDKNGKRDQEMQGVMYKNAFSCIITGCLYFLIFFHPSSHYCLLKTRLKTRLKNMMNVDDLFNSPDTEAAFAETKSIYCFPKDVITMFQTCSLSFSLSFSFWFFLMVSSPSSLMIIMASIWSSHKKKTRVWLSLTRDYIHATGVPFSLISASFLSDLFFSCLCRQSLSSVSVFQSLSFFSFVLSSLRRKVSDSREEVMQVFLTLIPSLLFFFFFSSSHRFALSLILFLIFLWLLSSFLCISCLSFSDSCDLSSATIFIALFLSTSVHFFVFALSSLSFCSLDTFLSVSVSAFLLYQWHQ